MTPAPHLSSLTLDEMAAGLPVAPELQAHARTCARCGERLVRVEEERRLSAAAPGYQATFRKVRALAESPRPARFRWGWAFVLAPALAAATVLLWVLPARGPDDDGIRLKGGASVALLRSGGEPARGPLHPGESVTLLLQGAGASQALVMAVDERGHVEQLWPAGSSSSGALPAGVVRAGTFEVTEGSFTLYAFFSNEPLPSREAAAALERAWRQVGSPGPGAALNPEHLPGERARTRYEVQVETRR